MSEQIPNGSRVRTVVRVAIKPNSEDEEFYIWNGIPGWPDEKILKSSASQIVTRTKARGFATDLPHVVFFDPQGREGVVIDKKENYHLVRFDDGSEVIVIASNLVVRHPLTLLAEQAG